jgi:hypothetical protein
MVLTVEEAARRLSIGRRVLVSRDWLGKTVADHKADARAWLRALLGVSVRHDRADVVGPQRGTPAPIAWDFARRDKAPNSAPRANEPGRSRRRTFLNRDRLVARRTDHCG